MAAKPESSVRMAVRASLVRCSQSCAPLACLAEFIEELLELGWDAESARRVEKEALAVLSRQLELRHEHV